MENRKAVAVSVPDEEPVQTKGRDFEPVETYPPQTDDRPKPPAAYDCKVPRHDSPEEHGGKRD